jgi:hypothetical protein
MQYKDHEFQYEIDHLDLETESVRQQSSGKAYRRKRPIRGSRKRPAKTASHPGFGIAGRRNRRWTW